MSKRVEAAAVTPRWVSTTRASRSASCTRVRNCSTVETVPPRKGVCSETKSWNSLLRAVSASCPSPTGIFGIAIRRTLPRVVARPSMYSAWQMPMSPARLAQPALPLDNTSITSQSRTACRQVSQLSSIASAGGASSLIQTSNTCLPNSFVPSISRLSCSRIELRV
ncbi:hypothetical protein D3C86_1545990 [compost metagenome]